MKIFQTKFPTDMKIIAFLEALLHWNLNFINAPQFNTICKLVFPMKSVNYSQQRKYVFKCT